MVLFSIYFSKATVECEEDDLLHINKESSQIIRTDFQERPQIEVRRVYGNDLKNIYRTTACYNYMRDFWAYAKLPCHIQVITKTLSNIWRVYQDLIKDVIRQYQRWKIWSIWYVNEYDEQFKSYIVRAATKLRQGYNVLSLADGWTIRCSYVVSTAEQKFEKSQFPPVDKDKYLDGPHHQRRCYITSIY